MKRILFLALALLMLTATAASAESLFTLVTTAPTTETPEAAVPEDLVYPSYAVMADTIPFTTETLEDGGTRLTFISVADESFLSFGALLNERGFTIDMSSYAVSGQQQTMTLIKDGMAFSLVFDQARHMLVLTYPQGAVLETVTVEDPFASTHIELRSGATVKLTGTLNGTFTFNGFSASYPALYRDYDYIYHSRTGAKGNYSWRSKAETSFLNALMFSFDNTGHSSIDPYTLITNQVLHYVNADSHYTYDNNGYLCEQEVGAEDYYQICRILLHSDYSSNNYTFSQPSLTTFNYIQTIPYPNTRVAQATDGIIAVTFKIAGSNTDYVYYIRRPGDPVQ